MLEQLMIIGPSFTCSSPEGFLVLGQAETLGPQGWAALTHCRRSSAPIERRRHRASAAAAERRRLGALCLEEGVRRLDAEQPEKASWEPRSLASSSIVMLRLEVVVDADRLLFESGGLTGAYLEAGPGGGEKPHPVEDVVRGIRSTGCWTASHAVRKRKAMVRRTGPRVKFVAGSEARLLWMFLPLTSSGRPHHLVLLEELNKGRNDGDGDAEPVMPWRALAPRATARTAVRVRTAGAGVGRQS